MKNVAIKLGVGLLTSAFTFLSYANATSGEHKQLVLEALSKFENTPRAEWGYQVKRYENEEGDVTSSIERYQPGAEGMDRWLLLETNGKTPTDKEAQKFAKRKLKQEQQKGSEQGLSLSLRKLIRQETLVLQAEDDNHFTMGFKVIIDRLGEEAQEKLTGSLTFNKRRRFIETIDITSTDAFSPMFMVSITSFSMSLHFLKIGDAILPKENQMQMKGKMSFLTEIDEYSVDTFSDYVFSAE